MAGFDPETRVAALAERVDNQGNRLVQIEGAMNRGFAAVENSITALSTEMRTGSKPQWQAISILATVIIAVFGGVGALVWVPVKADISEIKQEQRSDRRDAVSVEAFQNFRQQYDGNRQSYRIDVDNTFRKVEEKLKDVVPRGEHDREWRNTEQRFTDMQRQIDETKKFQQGLVSAPDYLKGLDERLRLIELRALRPTP